MTPTNKLRFVERFVPVIGTNYGGTVRVLQQWWQKQYLEIDEVSSRLKPIEGEWRDVPLEKE